MSTNFEETIKKVFYESLQDPIWHIFPVNGGSINNSIKVTTQSAKNYFVKYNNGSDAKELLHAELNGLKLLAGKTSLNIPEIVHFRSEDHGPSLLILKYIEKCNSSKCMNWEDAALQLYELHSVKNTKYGLDTHNFIGNMVQLNYLTDSWVELFGTYRLNHQGNIYAKTKGADKKMLKKLDTLILKLPDFLECKAPSLLHGDLWNGNLIHGSDNKPWFIDPSVYYGHFEVDLAMTKLFGGFPNKFYETYYSCNKPEPGNRERNSIYQLYYLLVHLNMFGDAYLKQIHSILNELT
jgi:protein-ribulosamine 3-kinase